MRSTQPDSTSPERSEVVIPEISIHLAALGEWRELPELKTPFSLSLEEVHHQWREDLIERAWESGAFTKGDLKRMRRAPKVIFAELSFQPYVDREQTPHFPSPQLRWARSAAKLLKRLTDEGAVALYYDGATRVVSPELIAEVDPKDHATLFHLFVEVWGDADHVVAEGMSIFGLPDVVMVGLDPQSAEAQATTFSAAAQLVCDGLRLPSGSHFRSSESFPWCEARWELPELSVEPERGSSGESSDPSYLSDEPDDEPDDESGDEELINACGRCVLRPVSSELSAELTRAWELERDA